MHDDYSFHFDAIVVVESLLPGRDLASGTKLYQDVLLPLRARRFAAGSGPHMELRTATGRAEFLEHLHALAGWAMNGSHSPIVHFECHGNDDGLVAADGLLVSWQDLQAPLTAINQASRMNLVVTLAACRGLGLIKTLALTERSPVTVIIGPSADVLVPQVVAGYQSFYSELLENLDAGRAFAALHSIQSNGKPAFDVRPARLLFAWILSRYFRTQLVDESVKRRLDAMLDVLRDTPAMMVLGRAELRRRLKGDLENRAFWLEKLKHTFFMLDLFPENRARFDVSLAECEEVS